MKNLTKLVNGTRKAVGLGLAGAVFLGSMGCATMTQAQKTALWGDALSILGEFDAFGNKTKGARFANDALTISSAVVNRQAQMQENLEVAGAGRDQIVINTNTNPPNNNNNSNYQNQNQSQNYSQNQNYNSENDPTPKGFFMYKNFVDRNNNRQANGKEFFGFNESVYDLRNLDDLFFSFYGGGDNNYNGHNLNLKIYSLDDGRTIRDFNQKCISSEIQTFDCWTDSFLESGKYKAVLNIGNETFPLYFDIIK
jgi:hypothetical protein